MGNYRLTCDDNFEVNLTPIIGVSLRTSILNIGIVVPARSSKSDLLCNKYSKGDANSYMISYLSDIKYN